MALKVMVMYIDDLDNVTRDVAGMKSKVKKLKSALKADELADDFTISQNKEPGHEYFTAEFKISAKRVKKVLKIVRKSEPYMARIYWYKN